MELPSCSGRIERVACGSRTLCNRPRIQQLAALPHIYSPLRRRKQFNPVVAWAAASYSDLETYKLSSSVGPAPWFQGAIREVVRHLSSSPFLQIVRFGSSPAVNPKYSSFGVSESVVAAPELWSSIAETLSCDTADVVILVQRVDDSQSASQPENQPMTRTHSREMKIHVEDACRKLVASGIGVRLLQGHVGDCCAEDDLEQDRTRQQSSSIPSSSISCIAVPKFASPSTTATSRTAVRVTALPVEEQANPVGGATHSGAASVKGYWGVVVQSKHHGTGSEGCYLLKAVKNVPNSSTGCTCTHFSLTRVCQGEHLERQFVQSWLV